MVKKPSVPCTGCGRLLWTGRGCRPDPLCQPCRRKRPGYAGKYATPRPPIQRRCQFCGAEFATRQPRARYCGTACRNRAGVARRRTKRPYHKGKFHVDSRKVRDRANADPRTRCWRCGRTMAEVREQKPNAFWTAGHLRDQEIDGELAAECSPCNFGTGARRGNRARRPKRAVRTDLTW